MDSQGATNSNATTSSPAGSAAGPPIFTVKQSLPLPPGYQARPQGGPPPRFPQNPVNNQLPAGPRPAGPPQFRRLDSRASLGPPGPGQYPQARPHGPQNPSGNAFPPRPGPPGQPQYQNFQQSQQNPQNWQNNSPRSPQLAPTTGIRGPGPQPGPRPNFPPHYQGQQPRRNGNDQQAIRKPIPEQNRLPIGQQFQRSSQESIIPTQRPNNSSINLQQYANQIAGGKPPAQSRNIPHKMADVGRPSSETERPVSKEKTEVRENGEKDDDDDVVIDNDNSTQHNGSVSPSSQRSVASPKGSVKSVNENEPADKQTTDVNFSSKPPSAKVDINETLKRPTTATLSQRIDTNIDNVTNAVEKECTQPSIALTTTTKDDKVDTKDSSEANNEKMERKETLSATIVLREETKTEPSKPTTEDVQSKEQERKESATTVDDKKERPDSAKSENNDLPDKEVTQDKEVDEKTISKPEQTEDATDSSNKIASPKMEDEAEKRSISSSPSTRPSTATVSEKAEDKQEVEDEIKMKTKDGEMDKETKEVEKVEDSAEDKTKENATEPPEQTKSNEENVDLSNDSKDSAQETKTPPKTPYKDEPKATEEKDESEVLAETCAEKPTENPLRDKQTPEPPVEENPSVEKSSPPSAGKSSPPSTGKSSPPSAGKSPPPSTGKSSPPSAGKSSPPSTGKSLPPSAGKSSPPSTGKSSPPLTDQKLSVPGTLELAPKSPDGSVKGYDNGQRRSLSSRSSPTCSPSLPKSPAGEADVEEVEKKTTASPVVEKSEEVEKRNDEDVAELGSGSIPGTPTKTRERSQTPEKDRPQAEVQNGTSGNESSQINTIPTTNGVESSPAKKSPSKTNDSDKRSVAGSPVKSPSKSVKSLPRTPETPSSTCQEKKKLPMNKIQVGAAPSPNLKTVRSKIGSLENASYKPGGGKVKIENRKLDFSKAQPKIAAKNEKYTPSGGDKKIAQQKLQWNAKPKVGSLENATYKPGGGDKKIETVKLDFKDKAKPKVGSKDNAKHVPGGGAVKPSATPPKTPQESNVDIQTQKLDIKAESKIGSLENVKHKPGGGNKKIFNDTDYLRQTGSNVESLSGSGSQSPVPPSLLADGKNGLPTSDENLNQE